MRRTSVVLLCLTLVVGTAAAQHKKRAAAKPPAEALAAVLQAKVTQAWDDFKNKRKDAFAAILADDFIVVDEDGLGPRDRQSELEDFDRFNLAQYVLRDITVKPLGPDAAMVMYQADYSGQLGRERVHDKVAVTQVWVRERSGWKCMHMQMTRMI